MLSVDREKAIYEYIKQHHSATVTELSKNFFVSETSIRRDLQKLASMGLIRKTYGGAVIVQGNNEVIALEARRQLEREAKQIIAQKAADLVKNGDVIFLDSSSTALAMVPFLARLSDLSIFTTSLQVANALARFSQFKIYVLGGLLNNRTFSFNGTLTQKLIENTHANCAFISPKGMDESGAIYCTNEEEAQTRRMMIDRSDQAILLCSQKKFSQHAAFLLCNLSEISTVVCEKSLDKNWLKIFEEKDVVLL